MTFLTRDARAPPTQYAVNVLKNANLEAFKEVGARPDSLAYVRRPHLKRRCLLG